MREGRESEEARRARAAKINAGILFSIVVLVGMCGVAVNGASDKSSTTESATHVKASRIAQPTLRSDKTGEVIEPSSVGQQWSYFTNTDEMSSGEIRYARIQSENMVKFDFPYGGPQRATLTLRTHPRHGKDIIFQIDRGQILCHEWSGVNQRCPVRVRFDDGTAAAWTALPSADHSTESMFFRDYGEFVGRLKNAEVVRIQPNIYQEGQPVFEFNVSGFDAERYAGK